ncbi:transient receptor potential cation channel protein painless-like [Planococcus citri]|uniref:transient receptor potential cation channel protein painless-like n=1 Tax=Planococcus citri TaxID=170843 RepID=UPI0031F9B79A
MNQQKLLVAFKKKNYEDFLKLLDCDDTDINYFYGEPDNGTLLDLANRSMDLFFIFRILRDRGAKTWYKDAVTGKLVIHEVFKNLDPQILKCVWLEGEFVKAKQRYEKGTDIMLTAVTENDVEAMEVLAHSYSLVYTDGSHYNSYLHMELLRGSIDAVRVFVKFFDVDREFQRDSNGCAYTCREIILQKYPELESELPTEPSSSKLAENLFFYLHRNAPELFLNRVNDLSTEMLNDSRDTDGKTYLHVACECNYTEVVDELLKRKIQLNPVAPLCVLDDGYMNEGTPIMVAAYRGHLQIFITLLRIPEVELQIEGKGSVLHAVLHGMWGQQVRRYAKSNVTDYHFEILENVFEDINRLNVDFKDAFRMTALQWAMKFNNKFVIKKLLNAGAKLRFTDYRGKFCLTSTSATIIESYLDDCIKVESSSRYSLHDHHIRREGTDDMKLNYTIFKKVLKNSTKTGGEMELFIQSRFIPELRTVVKHPLSKSFIYLKWCLVKKYYYISLAFYLLICLVLSLFIFQTKDCLTSPGNLNSFSATSCDVSSWLRWMIVLCLIILIAWEVCQLLISSSICPYVSLDQTPVLFLIIWFVGLLLTKSYDTELAAAIILASWFRFTFLLAKHPFFSIYIEMFIVVGRNFLKFFVLYIILIGSFAYSFFIMFRNKTDLYASPEDKNSINLWQSPLVSLLKSIIMMTGEFDASSLPLGSNFSTSYIFFIAFVFLISIVLYNLLNGLAVSDIQAIKEDAEFFALVTRAELIAYWERLIHSTKFGDKLLNLHVTDFVILNSGKNNFIKVLSQRTIHYEIIGKMPPYIVKQIEQLLEKRNQSYFDKICTQQHEMKNNQAEKESIDKLVHQLSEKIHDIKLENDAKITRIGEQITDNSVKMSEIDKKVAGIDVKMAEIGDKIAGIDVKMAEIGDKIAKMKGKAVEHDENLLQRVDQRINKLMESIEQALIAHLKQKE